MTDPTLHPGVSSLGFLVGHWAGEGEGRYPTVADFAYGEEVRFSHVGKPFLAYSQRTWSLDDGRPLHAEVGYLRPGPAGNQRVELLVAHPSGVVEIEEGSLSGTHLRLATTELATTPTAKEVSRLERELAVDGDTLRYELRMAAVGHPLQFHLAATLKRA